MPERLSYIRTTEELEQLAPRWRALWSQDPHATPFQSSEWLLPWWRCFGEDLRSVSIHHDGELVGLLPFYTYHEPLTRQRQLLPLGVGTSDYLDGVFSPACSVDAIRNGLDMLCGNDDWDVLCVSQLRPASRLLAALQHWEPHAGTAIQGDPCSRMAAVPMAGLPQKLRRNAMYYRNRARRAGNLRFELAGTSSCLEIFDALVRLQGERWRHREERGVFADERVVAWHRDAIPQLERAGLLRLCALRLNGDIIAAVYSLIDPPGRPGRAQYFYLPAFSEAHADLRPGTVLTAMAVEHAAEEGVRTIDMLRGDEDYKRIWHVERTPTFGFVRRRDALRGPTPIEREVAA